MVSERVGYQLEDSDQLQSAVGDKPINIGDIFPGHQKVLHIWCRYDWTAYQFARLKKLVRVSADELDSVHLRFPMPAYLRSKIIERLFTAVVILFMVMAICGFIGQVYGIWLDHLR
jgi:hypothetical protein